MLEKIVSSSAFSEYSSPVYYWTIPQICIFRIEPAIEDPRVLEQDLLKNLLKYRDFDFYKKPLVETGTLFENIDLVTTTHLSH